MEIAARGFQQAIEWIYRFSGDYGIAIVVITVVIRILLIPLNIQQRKQLKKQQEISEKAEQLKRKYQNNEQKMNIELQKLYQEKGIGGGGCLMSLLQFPIMMCLYNGIRLTAAAGAATILLPWVSSLLVKDRTLILPAATLIVQFLPQMYPYIGYFKVLNLQKMSPPMALSFLVMNGMFAFMIPSGVGLYYFASGVFSAIEQLTVHVLALRKFRQIEENA